MKPGSSATNLIKNSCIPGFQSHGFPNSFHVWEIDIRGHSGAQAIVVSGQTNLHAEYLFDAVSDSLHIARRKFGLPINLLDDSFKIGVRERIHAYADLLT